MNLPSLSKSPSIALVFFMPLLVRTYNVVAQSNYYNCLEHPETTTTWGNLEQPNSGTMIETNDLVFPLNYAVFVDRKYNGK